MSLKNDSKNAIAALSRRNFIKSSAYTGGALLLPPASEAAVEKSSKQNPRGFVVPASPHVQRLDLSPARWIWYPSARCLQNTFVLFRKEINLTAKPRRATGWILADSRYQLQVNGKRIQWGPAPCDPRWVEADPLDLTEILAPGKNAIGAQVLFFGQGDGTWPMGKPGFLFTLEIETADGTIRKIVSDASWLVHLARSWKPGQYKRWYLRSLQEEFDARLFPYGWSETKFIPNADWLPAMDIDCPANKPSLCSDYSDYMQDIKGDSETCFIRPRRIPLLREYLVPVEKLSESFTLQWKRTPEEYFECQPPDAFQVDRTPVAQETGAGIWKVRMNGKTAAALTFELKEQVVGWPYFTIEAPAGTVVELLVHEAHQVGGPPLLDNHHNTWSRFICREGVNTFEPFDFESCRWIQLHIHHAKGEITVRDIGVLRRIFPWPNSPQISCSEPALQRLMDASVNTLHNCAQETLVDGMARERQQYSGDCGHQTHAIYFTFGEAQLPARYLSTFSQGLTLDGYFLDCWPAYDRLARLQQRQMQLTKWGPILDHGVGFNFDCWHHYLYTGRLTDLEEPYPRLVRFMEYLQSIQEPSGLLPVENLGIPSVWIDHNAYQKTRHKQCAFNLYAAAMLEHALAPICHAFGDADREKQVRRFGKSILHACIQHFWDHEKALFVANLPWLSEEKQLRLCDRSLATSILFDQCPRHNVASALRALVECPPEMGFSYPANAGWRLWALSKGGRTDVVLKDLRERWATMSSVIQNCTLQEDWKAEPDSPAQWSHCPVAPLYVLFMNIAGIRPLEPGFTRCEIRPQPADLEKLNLTAHTAQGPLRFASAGKLGNREITLQLPSTCDGELVVSQNEPIELAPISRKSSDGLSRYHLPGNQEIRVRLKYS